MLSKNSEYWKIQLLRQVLHLIQVDFFKHTTNTGLHKIHVKSSFEMENHCKEEGDIYCAIFELLLFKVSNLNQNKSDLKTQFRFPHFL